MDTTRQSIHVTPRIAGDPRPNTLGLRLAHRAMLRDAGRLTNLAEALAAGSATADRPRGAVIAHYVADFCDSIHAHHSADDDVLWPVPRPRPARRPLRAQRRPRRD
jgi:hypothetical protein